MAFLFSHSLVGGAHFSAQDDLGQTPDFAVGTDDGAGDGGFLVEKLPEVGRILLEVGTQVNDVPCSPQDASLSLPILPRRMMIGQLGAGVRDAGHVSPQTELLTIPLVSTPDSSSYF